LPRFPTQLHDSGAIVESLPPGPPWRAAGPTIAPTRTTARERKRRPHEGAAVAGGLVSRVLSRVPWRGNARLAIYLGRASPHASSGQPGDVGEPGRLSLPIGPCTGWGLPSCLCYQGHWCALTAPFHPYVRRSPTRPACAVCFLLH